MFLSSPQLQLVLLAVLLIAMASILIGLFAGGSYADPSVDSYVIPDESASGASESASNETLWTGFVGVGKGMLGENMLPHFDEKENFFSVFAVFFPAATGIMAGANISGPSCYLVCVCVCVCVCVRARPIPLRLISNFFKT